MNADAAWARRTVVAALTAVFILLDFVRLAFHVRCAGNFPICLAPLRLERVFSLDLRLILRLRELLQPVDELGVLEAPRRPLGHDARAVPQHDRAVVAPVAVVEEEHVVVGDARRLSYERKVRLGFI